MAASEPSAFSSAGASEESDEESCSRSSGRTRSAHGTQSGAMSASSPGSRPTSQIVATFERGARERVANQNQPRYPGIVHSKRWVLRRSSSGRTWCTRPILWSGVISRTPCSATSLAAARISSTLEVRRALCGTPREGSPGSSAGAEKGSLEVSVGVREDSASSAASVRAASTVASTTFSVFSSAASSAIFCAVSTFSGTAPSTEVSASSGAAAGRAPSAGVSGAGTVSGSSSFTCSDIPLLKHLAYTNTSGGPLSFTNAVNLGPKPPILGLC